MVLRKEVTALALCAALAASPAVVFAQSQADETGVGAAAGQEEVAGASIGGVSVGVVAGVAVAAAVAIAVAASLSDDDVAAATTPPATTP